MSGAAYPAYKESGVEWIGSIPVTWTAQRMSFLFRAIGSGTTPPTDTAAYYDGDVPWVTTGELREEPISDTTKKLTSEALAAFPTLRMYPPGTLLIAMYGATIGRLGWLSVSACTNQACCALAEPDGVHTRYAYFALLAANEALLLMSSGGGQPNINQEKIRAFRLPAPPLDEQVNIAAFLDRKTAKIDALVAEQERLMALLKEKRQAVISQAVTKGLDPNAPMKDSGVAWLGEVPAHWEVTRLKYLGQSIIGLTYDPSQVVDEGHGTLVLRSSNVQRGRIALEDTVYVATLIPPDLVTLAGDILICSRNGSRALIGKNAVIDGVAVGQTFGAFMTVFRSQHSAYVRWLLNSPLFEFQSGAFLTSTINQLTVGVLNNFEVPLPPEQEREAIASFLDRETAKIDALVADQERAITLLRERRAALISAAVTGKIDVRHLAPAAQAAA